MNQKYKNHGTKNKSRKATFHSDKLRFQLQRDKNKKVTKNTSTHIVNLRNFMFRSLNWLLINRNLQNF